MKGQNWNLSLNNKQFRCTLYFKEKYHFILDNIMFDTTKINLLDK